ncbi:MAG TPA: 3-phosphoshikimate 1-carboxyvinyltransferase [Longimicrobiales bacterium]|nr:3-phosphoshikimate 1-carboxyvinyltransferase [Longimicrobiales bacterium]
MKRIRVPGDKSITHRALILAAIGAGRSRIRGHLVSADTQSTATILRQLGCPIPLLEGDAELVVDGVGLHGLVAPHAALDCGNSGTTARLLMGLLAGSPFHATLTGDASLRSRPMRRVTRPLGDMGVEFAELEQPGRLPVRMRGGSLHAIDYASPHASAQVKSAVLLAGLTGAVTVSVTEPLLSRDHTERLLLRLGVTLTQEREADGPATVRMEPVAELPPLDVDVPGDFSSAAFAVGAACIAAPAPVAIAGVGLNPTRTGFLAVLGRMGARVTVVNSRTSGGEPVGDVVVERASLTGTRVRPEEVPGLVDEIPVLAVLAATASGVTTFEGAGELRMKESDRIAALVANLRVLGVEADEREDGLVVHGLGRPLAGRVRTMQDHRIAMAFGLLAAAGSGAVEIDDPEVVGISYPDYWTMLHDVTTP